MPATLLGIAHHLPDEESIGSVRRPIFREPGGPSDLALPPALRALRQAGLEPTSVDFIIFATMTPDATFPGAGCFFQEKLQSGTIGALDIRAQCSGFLTGLMVADGFLEAGTYDRILLAAGEVHSAGLDYSERGAPIAELYGDGAAVAVLGRDGEGPRLEAVVCHSDGRLYDRFWCEYPASRQHPVRIAVDHFRAGRHFPSIDFRVVEEFGRTHLPAAVREVLARASLRGDDVDLFIASHILPAVEEQALRELDLPAARWLGASRAHGHLSAATLPVALSEAIAAGRLGAGARVCLATCGAGFTWGAALLKL